MDGEPAEPMSLSDSRGPGRRRSRVSKVPRLTRRCGRPAAGLTGAIDPLSTEERLRRYAELAVRVGANVQEGQDVTVTGHL